MPLWCRFISLCLGCDFVITSLLFDTASVIVLCATTILFVSNVVSRRYVEFSTNRMSTSASYYYFYFACHHLNDIKVSKSAKLILYNQLIGVHFDWRTKCVVLIEGRARAVAPKSIAGRSLARVSFWHHVWGGTKSHHPYSVVAQHEGIISQRDISDGVPFGRTTLKGGINAHFNKWTFSHLAWINVHSAGAITTIVFVHFPIASGALKRRLNA